MGLRLDDTTAVQLTAAFVEPPGPGRTALFERALASSPDLAAFARTNCPDEGCAVEWMALNAVDRLDLDASDVQSPAVRTLRLLIARLREHQQFERSFHARLEAEKLAAMRELAYGASHEINNPLANIASRAQTLLQDETDPQRRRKLAIINTQAFRAFEMIADLMLFAKPPPPDKQPLELRALVDGVIAELAPTAAEQQTALTRSQDSVPVELAADRTQIEMAVRALIRNSLEALGAGGEVRVAVYRATDPADQSELAEIIVTDTGPGIPDELLPRVFDPFFSGREAGRGLGLGLSKCWRVAELHGGRIIVDRPSHGAQLRLQLPLL